MVSKTEALEYYNQIHSTNYVSVVDLGKALVAEALREAYVAHKRNEAHEIASKERVE